MTPPYYYYATFILSFLLVLWIHPRLVRIALLKDIVDRPGFRKFQSRPVPVLGGVAVFFGIVVSLGCMSIVVSYSGMPIIVTSLLVMLYLGTMDDILNLSALFRLVVEVVVVLLLLFIGGCEITDFHGLWGVDALPRYVSIPLTVFASVGIINAINLVDGVNGLSSGFCIVASLFFGIYFCQSGDVSMQVLSVSSMGALFPFFLHNVFGRRSRMFIGDGGTLVMGTVMSIFVTKVLSEDTVISPFGFSNVGLIPFTLSVLSIPVFDTLRVMTTRLLRGVSAFHPDRTHLHHLFLTLGCSHVATTLVIVGLNTLVVVFWWLLVVLGAGVDIQLYGVVALSLCLTLLLYHFLQRSLRRDTRFIGQLRRFGYRTHISRTGVYLWLQRVVDKF